ncbi:hypothetical protein PCC9214_05337 [Planktothrix tepida]|uniref:Uncharacterized protein n=1 Tax=Planktothrix tepida PCC 9214 TaxID=671072 RepID=A0A1J1LIU8_9CYAN|nr:hypothetical protein [Planktothrix tepida]CAD5984786.1 hypothetical protein PCC9214_05301 [Planktothrix tepida]CAD5985068.1 hypothetical protein PCC9214_05337 [Planktothrix tepida]CUR32150.1 hypothetical protein PL9214430122 [Planktothrix tepida PCC 9214]
MPRKIKLSKKDDVIESIESSTPTPSSRRGARLAKKDPKAALAESIESKVKEAVLKIEKHRANQREDTEIANGKGGGENLEFFADDISNDYGYTKKDSKQAKEKPTTDFILRPVSEMDVYNSRD